MNKKYIIIISTVLLISLSLGLFMLAQSKIKPTSIVQEDPIIAQSRLDYEKIREVKLAQDFDKCNQGLTEIKHDECVSKIVMSVSDPVLCDKIIDEAKKSLCTESFVVNNIISENNISKCSSLKTSFNELCFDNFFKEYKGVDECVSLESREKQRCGDVVNNKNAILKSDISICDNVVDNNLKNDCKNIIETKPKDADGDNLTDQEENSYGTNPTNSDTDGDGLSDYDEIFKYNTNPLKKDTKGNGYGDAIQKNIK